MSRCMHSKECQRNHRALSKSGRQFLNAKTERFQCTSCFFSELFCCIFTETCMQLLPLYPFSSFPGFVTSPPLCLLQWLTRSPSPLRVICFHPLSSHLPGPSISPSLAPTFAHFLHQQASNTLQVTFKKIDLFLRTLHPSEPSPSFSSPSSCSVFSHRLPLSSLVHVHIHWLKQHRKLNWLVVRNRLTVDP